MNGGKERDLDSLIAGGLGGWWVFGERTAVCPSLCVADDHTKTWHRSTLERDPLTRQINEQIVLYVLSRTLVSLLPRLYSTTPNPPALPFSPLEHPLPPLTSKAANPGPIPIAPMPFAIVAAASWAGVMYMFRHRGERLQAGMGNSMRKSTFVSMEGEGRLTGQGICIMTRRFGVICEHYSGIISRWNDQQPVAYMFTHVLCISLNSFSLLCLRPRAPI